MQKSEIILGFIIKKTSALVLVHLKTALILKQFHLKQKIKLKFMITVLEKLKNSKNLIFHVMKLFFMKIVSMIVCL